MNRRYILLHDGTELPGTIGFSDGVIWCYIPGVSILDVFPAFSAPEKTKRLEFHYGEMKDVYDGYTSIGAMLQDETQVKIMLRKEE